MGLLYFYNIYTFQKSCSLDKEARGKKTLLNIKGPHIVLLRTYKGKRNKNKVILYYYYYYHFPSRYINVRLEAERDENISYYKGSPYPILYLIEHTTLQEIKRKLIKSVFYYKFSEISFDLGKMQRGIKTLDTKKRPYIVTEPTYNQHINKVNKLSLCFLTTFCWNRIVVV